MKFFYFITALFLFQSCVPVQVAPKLKNDKVTKGKKFKKDLPDVHTYIFRDPKDVDEFYNYINIKYECNDEYVDDMVPVIIDDHLYYLSWYETDKSSSTLNLGGMIVDKALENEGVSPLFDRTGYTRTSDTWYIALHLLDFQRNDVLHPDHEKRDRAIQFFKEMRQEYLSTDNYYQAYLKRGY